MTFEIGEIEAIFRYPVKSMAGERLDAANLGWHGIDGDRRLGLRRMQVQTDFPWLTAGKLPELLLFTPIRREAGQSPTHVRTPEGREVEIFGDELAADVARRHGAPVEMMRMKHGIFDEGSVSVITSDTVREIGRLSAMDLEIRRFRPNVVIRSLQPTPFEENGWVGGVLLFGDDDTGPAISVTLRDERCAMLNLDPDTARSSPEVMKAVVRANQNDAGIYGTVIRGGQLAVGQTVRLQGAGTTEDAMLAQP